MDEGVRMAILEFHAVCRFGRQRGRSSCRNVDRVGSVSIQFTFARRHPLLETTNQLLTMICKSTNFSICGSFRLVHAPSYPVSQYSLIINNLGCVTGARATVVVDLPWPIVKGMTTSSMVP